MHQEKDSLCPAADADDDPDNIPPEEDDGGESSTGGDGGGNNRRDRRDGNEVDERDFATEDEDRSEVAFGWKEGEIKGGDDDGRASGRIPDEQEEEGDADEVNPEEMSVLLVLLRHCSGIIPLMVNDFLRLDFFWWSESVLFL